MPQAQQVLRGVPGLPSSIHTQGLSTPSSPRGVSTIAAMGTPGGTAFSAAMAGRS